MSDVAQGPGWWIASDGKWYPPESHPAATPPPPPTVPAATALPAGPVAAPAFPASPAAAVQPPPGPPPVFLTPPAQPLPAQPLPAQPPGSPPVPVTVPVPVARAPVVGGLIVGKPAANATWSDPEYRWDDSTFTNQQGARESSIEGLRRSADPRGAFVVVVSLVLIGACFVPYYNVPATLTASGETHLRVIATAMGAWRLVIPAVCVLTAAIGIANSALRVGQRGAVGVFVLLRLSVLAQLALWIIPIFVTKVYDTPPGVAPTSNGVTVGWVAYSCAAVAAVAVIGSFAAMGKSDTT